MKKVRVAVVGAGQVAGIHGDAYRGLDDAEVVAVVDTRVPNAERLANTLGCRAFGSLKEMLANATPDMVDLCLPTHLHAEAAVLSAEHGLHVLCEKPMALDMESALRMVDTCRRNGVQLMVAQVLRFWPEYVYLKQAFERGTYGKVKEAYFGRFAAKPFASWDGWMRDGFRSGGAPLDVHVHDVDFLVDLFGLPSTVHSIGRSEHGEIDHILTHYGYVDRLVIAEGAWYDAPVPFSMIFRVVFEDGVLNFQDGELVFHAQGRDSRRIPTSTAPGRIPGMNLPSTDAFVAEIAYFVACIRDGKVPDRVSPQSSLDVLRVLLKEVESLHAGSSVTI